MNIKITIEFYDKPKRNYEKADFKFHNESLFVTYSENGKLFEERYWSKDIFCIKATFDDLSEEELKNMKAMLESQYKVK